MKVYAILCFKCHQIFLPIVHFKKGRDHQGLRYQAVCEDCANGYKPRLVKGEVRVQ